MNLLESLRHRHPEHRAQCDRWALLEAMVAGGAAMTDAMKRKILPNPDGRPDAVVQERIKLATYTNKISPILTRFNSQLFSEPASFSGSKAPFWDDRFLPYGALLDGDDDARASFSTFLRESMFKCLVTGKAIAQIDTRIASGEALSLVDQDSTGELQPYVLLHPRSSLWDWESDAKGFCFAKLHRWVVKRDRWDMPPVGEHDFTIYQRTEEGAIVASRYSIRRRPKENEKPPVEPFDLDQLQEKDVDIIPMQMPNGQPLENVPIFNYRGVFEFPIVTLTVSPGLHIADQLFEPQKSFFAQTAALEYALYTNNFSIPVVSGVEDADDDPLKTQKIGEGYYLTLKPGQTISAFERPGRTITTAITYRGEIKRDIYDQLQQIALSAADGTAIMARSGASKREDRRPEQILLETYGQLIREYAVQILRVASIAHAEDVRWTVDGFDDFLGEGVLEEVTDMQQLQTVTIPSPTFKRETTKFLVRRVGKSYGLDAKAMTKAIEEIDQADAAAFEPPQPEPRQPPE
ncbi:MAG: hypothetical protein KME15_19815 [Drouetiella hepatica Uher 2000/2452]|jgi:hypothetical protein|uniref:DUF4055 domain-containing protein n=1 Tax=Drouetiella hepatica Uher 2000/2452 TaxID=904376 RepID=A0A951QDX0_9CYAN|nr:hypothetical protein [Drouetiella hepatica Uher 2000/2452]